MSDGYYWIKPRLDSEWEPAYWRGDSWILIGVGAPWKMSKVWETGKRIRKPK